MKLSKAKAEALYKSSFSDLEVRAIGKELSKYIGKKASKAIEKELQDENDLFVESCNKSTEINKINDDKKIKEAFINGFLIAAIVATGGYLMVNIFLDLI